jgi:hypothetical protein
METPSLTIFQLWKLLEGREVESGLGEEALEEAGLVRLSRFAVMQGSLGGRLRARRLSAGRACSGWRSGLSGCGQAIWGLAGRRRRRGRGNCPQMAVTKKIPETVLWASFPEANRNEVLGC